jgi:hypothetical protein
MSDRRRDPPPPPEEVDPPELDDEDDEDDEVEYFVEVELVDSVLTSVPNSAHWSQTCSSAPSTFTVFGDDVSVPHISHWTMAHPLPRRCINDVPVPGHTVGRNHFTHCCRMVGFSYGLLRLVTATPVLHGRFGGRTNRSSRPVPKRVAIIRISGSTARFAEAILTLLQPTVSGEVPPRAEEALECREVADDGEDDQ